MEAARRRYLLLDGLLALVIGTVILTVSHWAAMWQVPPRRPLDSLAYGLIVLAAAPLALRRVWPLVTLGCTVGAIVAYLALRYPYGPIFLTWFIAIYSVAARLPAWRSLAVCVPAAAAVCVPGLLSDGPGQLVVNLSWAIAWLLAPWAVGAGKRYRDKAVAHEREQDARRRAYEERLLVAREVHDVVGHGLAVINMQAGVALHVLERRPEQARVALEAIKQASKEALDELRGTLAVFRQPEESGSPRRPAPGLGQLDGLVAAMAESGLSVGLEVHGERATLPATVDLAAYRIVQESLTNVLRHAGPTTATVHVGYDRSQVVLEVTDSGRARPGSPPRPGGHGIAGMRERAAAMGGVLEAGPRPEGGFRVWARLPFGGSQA